MFNPHLNELAHGAYEERVANALLASAHRRALDGGPLPRRAHVPLRARCGRFLVRTGGWVGGFDAEPGAHGPLALVS
jgi:hypothetical protein